MKTIIILFMIAVATSISAPAQTGKASLEQTIDQFVNAIGSRDVYRMHYLLHEKFQSVEKTGILSKSDYMKMLGDRKLGGTELKSQILAVDLGETSASVKVRISTDPEWIELFIHLCKNDLGLWQELAEKYGMAYPSMRSRVQRGRERLKQLFYNCCHIETDNHGNILAAQGRTDCEGPCKPCAPDND